MFISHAFITNNNKILLFHRDNIPTIKDPDCWDIIGGHSEENETPDETLLREIKEEIDLSPQRYNLLFSEPDVWGEETHVYHMPLTDQEVTKIKLGNEGQEVKFFTFEELPHLKLTQNLTKYLKKYPDLIEKLIKS